jgi:tetratricopeptide (TPR) repeat protein
MKKLYKLPIFFCLGLSSLLINKNSIAQLSNVNGEVSILNSKTETGHKIYVPGVFVIDKKENASTTTTDYHGDFSLIYVGIPEKSTVHFKIETSKDLIVVSLTPNDITAVAGQLDTVQISMASREKAEAYFLKFLNNDQENRYRYIELTKTKIRSRLYSSTDSTQISNAQSELNKIALQESQIPRESYAFSRKYALVNLDNTPSILKEAILNYRKGKLTTALLILNSINYRIVIKKILRYSTIDSVNKTNKTNDSINISYIQSVKNIIQFKADLHQVLYQIDSSVKCYQDLLEIDSLDLKTLFNYGYFLFWHNDLDSALKYLKKSMKVALTISTDSNYSNTIIFKIKSIISQIYCKQGKYRIAKESLDEILKTYNTNTSPTIIPDIAWAMYYYGTLLKIQGSFDSSEIILDSAITLLGQIKSLLFEDYKNILLLIELELGDLYITERNFPKAEQFLKLNYLLIKSLFENNSEFRSSLLAHLYGRFAYLYEGAKFYDLAGLFYKEDIKISDSLFNIDPKIYGENLIGELKNYGTYFIIIRNYDLAFQQYSKAKTILKLFKGSDSLSYAISNADLLNQFGNYYYRIGDFSVSLKNLYESRSIFQALDNKEKNIYTNSLANVDLRLGNVLYSLTDTQNALKHLMKSIDEYNSLLKSDSPRFIPDIANVYKIIGDIYLDLGNLKSAEFYLLESSKLDSIAVYHFHLPNQLERANVYESLANAYLQAQDFVSTYSHISPAIYIYQHLPKSDSLIYRDNLAEAYRILGDTYIGYGYYPLSITNYKYCLNILNFIPDSKISTALIYNKIGAAYLNENKNDYAINYYDTSLTILQHYCASDSPKCLDIYLEANGTLGSIFLLQSNYDLSFSYLNTAEKISQKMYKKNPAKYSLGLAFLEEKLGDLYRATKNNLEATKKFNDALEIYKSMPDPQKYSENIIQISRKVNSY